MSRPQVASALTAADLAAGIYVKDSAYCPAPECKVPKTCIVSCLKPTAHIDPLITPLGVRVCRERTQEERSISADASAFGWPFVLATEPDRSTHKSGHLEKAAWPRLCPALLSRSNLRGARCSPALLLCSPQPKQSRKGRQKSGWQGRRSSHKGPNALERRVHGSSNRSHRRQFRI